MRVISSAPPFFNLSSEADDCSSQCSQCEVGPTHIRPSCRHSSCSHSMNIHCSSDPADERITWSVQGDVHLIGECTPCIWRSRPAGCLLGSNCDFCHLCPFLGKRMLQRHREQKRRARRRVRYRANVLKSGEANAGEKITVPLRDNPPVESGLKSGNAESSSAVAVGTMVLGQHGSLSAVISGTGRIADLVIGRPLQAPGKDTDPKSCMMEGVKLSL